MTPIFTYSRCK